MVNFHPINWNLVGLSQNPFHHTQTPEEANWAGFPKLKGQLGAIFGEALTSSKTQVVLNWGEYGSGKTHAATYFRQNDVLELTRPNLTESKALNVFSFYIRTPTEPEQANLLLYQSIIEAIGFKTIRTKISQEIASQGGCAKSALEKIQQIVGSEALGRALWLFGQEKSPTSQDKYKSGKLRLFQEDEASEEWHLLLESYLFSQTTKRDLRHLGLSRGINSGRDRFKILKGILQCLIGLDAKGTDHLASGSRIIFWLDEIESLIHYPSHYYDLFIQGLRDLIDQLPDYFTILINYSLSSPESLDDFTVILGQPLLDRVTHSVYFQEANEEEAFEYVRELLAFYRSESWEAGKLPEVYPFTEEALRCLIYRQRHPPIHLLGTPARLTPGHLNQRCTEAIRQALQNGIISSLGEGIIDKKFILSLEKEPIPLSMGLSYALR